MARKGNFPEHFENKKDLERENILHGFPDTIFSAGLLSNPKLLLEAFLISKASQTQQET